MGTDSWRTYPKVREHPLTTSFQTRSKALPADVGGTTLTPGAYKTQATPALGLTGTLTLDGQGDPNAVFVIQVGSALTTNVGSDVVLINGAQPCHVFWQIGSSATLGTSSQFAGSILAYTSISMNSGVTLNGRALARNGAVTLINDTITAPRCTSPADKRLRVRTLPATRVTDTSARLNGIVTVTADPSAGKITFYAHLDLEGPHPVSYGSNAPVKLPNKTGAYPVYASASGLPACSSFRYRFVGHDNHGTVLGNYQAFKTRCPAKPIAYSIGDPYHGFTGKNAPFAGSIDTRPSASALGGALQGLGYASHEELKGQTPQAVLQEAPAASVIGIFNHASAGVMDTGGGGKTFCEPVGLTGSRRSLSYCRHNHFLSLGNLLPNSLSGVRLLIFGGCDTANNGSRDYGNLMRTSKELGARSVIGFSGLIYYPRLGVPGVSHVSGSYFWSHFAGYLKRKFTIYSAWHRALADMATVNKAYGGVTDGYETLVIGGASPHPGNQRLTITGHHATGPAQDESAVRNRQGDLVEFSAPAATSGATHLSGIAARSAATRFLTKHAPHIASAHLTIVSQRRASHGAGEELESFIYRSHIAGIPGPAIALLEVDLRTGKVVFEAAGRATPSTTRFAITRPRAEIAALAAIGGRGRILSVSQDIWSYPRWTATLQQGGSLQKVELDAANGRVVGVSYADTPS